MTGICRHGPAGTLGWPEELSVGSGGAALVAVMQSTDLTHRHDGPDCGRLNRPWIGGSLSPATDGFGIDGNNPHTTQVFAAMISPRTRSHGRGTHAESSQSPAPHTHVAKVSAAPTALPQSPCLVPVPGISGRRCHRDPAAGSVGVGQRGKRSAVAGRSTPPSGVGSG